jgi:hypothetical protein
MQLNLSMQILSAILLRTQQVLSIRHLKIEKPLLLRKKVKNTSRILWINSLTLSRKKNRKVNLLQLREKWMTETVHTMMLH